MVSDNDAVLKARQWMIHNIPLNGNIIPKGNGELINTENLFITESLILDNSIGIKISLSQIIKYSGLSEDDRLKFKIVEPVAFLLKKNGIIEEHPYIDVVGQGLKLSDNIKKYVENYEIP